MPSQCKYDFIIIIFVCKPSLLTGVILKFNLPVIAVHSYLMPDSLVQEVTYIIELRLYMIISTGLIPYSTM